MTEGVFTSDWSHEPEGPRSRIGLPAYGVKEIPSPDVATPMRVFEPSQPEWKRQKRPALSRTTHGEFVIPRSQNWFGGRTTPVTLPSYPEYHILYVPSSSRNTKGARAYTESASPGEP